MENGARDDDRRWCMRCGDEVDTDAKEDICEFCVWWEEYIRREEDEEEEER